VAFVSPSITTWTLPIYELALLTSTWAAERSLDIEVRMITAERSPLEAFGPAAAEQVERLLGERGIVLHRNVLAEAFEGGQVWIPIEGTISADVAVALPMLFGPAVRGVPSDRLGFTPVDELCRVDGVDDVYAIGDMTTHPVKQGGLAAQQADVAAAAIAAAAGAPVLPEPYRPVLRGLLLTGGTPLYLRNPPVGDELMPAGADLTAP
jgi:sulfide:quinone oxidoreductase